MALNEPKIPGAEDSHSSLTLHSAGSNVVPDEKPSIRLSGAPGAHPRAFLTVLPKWVSEPLQSRRAWKVLLRCWVASLLSFVILLPDASLRTIGVTFLGHSGFFALLTSLLLPPYLPVQLTIFLLSTLVAGLLSGWGLGIGAMRAANAVRDQAFIHAVGLQIQVSINSTTAFQANPALAKSTAVFSGWFLDIRATAVYGAFLGVGAFIFGLMRAYAPKLIFMSIFGTIACCYMAIVVVTTISIFPETMSHAAMDTDLTRGGPLLSRFTALRARVIAAQQQAPSRADTSMAVIATAGFLSLEFTYGRWSGDDVRTLEEPMVALIARVGCLLNFDRLAGTSRPATPSSETLPQGADREAPAHDTYLLRQIHTRNAAREAKHGVRPDDVLPLLDTVTAELRAASGVALASVRDTVQLVNTTRWRRDRAREAGCTAGLDAGAARLRAAIDAFASSGQSALLAPFLLFLQTAGGEVEAVDPPLRALFIAYVFAADMVGITKAVLALVDLVRALAAKRERGRLWAPTGLRSSWKIVAARGDKTDGAFGDDTAAPVQADEEERTYKRDPDSRPPTNPMQKIMNGMHKVYQWSSTAEAVFTFKYVFISIALWLPAVIKHSAHFYYVEKGIWALIMAQTTLNIYAADQIFNYVTRLVGTLLGLAFGLLAWYAGNGKGTGNPYGAAVAVGVCIVPLLFVRIFAPERFLAGNILCCTTFALVVGYSWIDGHAVQFASPGIAGIGWSVAWKRWALVVVGAGASFVLMMLPPKSARQAVRQRNAASIVVLGECYAALVARWISSTGEDRFPAVQMQARLMKLADEMRAIRELTALARWEGSIRGKWPAAEYARLVEVQVDMVGSLAQLDNALGYLESEWRVGFVHSSKVLNPNFISDVMASFTLISQALRTGEPLHQVLPHNLLDRLIYHHRRAIPSSAVESGTDLRMELTIDTLKSPSYMHYASAMIAMYQLLTALDELHAITRELCGEVPLTGFSSWREEYERSRSVV
ncbi:hypothetical protein DFH09DRAFT_1472533 [Mycena vulgaris]|nr:hypothetical protein DFH09DRAFT_1472533 [Mycena vulgaris]